MRVACIFALGVALIACQKHDEPGSCYRTGDNMCIEYAGPQGAAGKRLCVGLKWTPGANSCQATGRLGTCTKKDAAELYYSGAPNNYDGASAKSACEHAGGTWTTGSGT